MKEYEAEPSNYISKQIKAIKEADLLYTNFLKKIIIIQQAEILVLKDRIETLKINK